MIRRSVLIGSSLVLLIGIFIFNDPPSFFYADLPFQSLSKQTVILLLKQSDEQMNKLAFDEEVVWYGTIADQGKEIDRLVSGMKKDGWSFLHQEGSGYFFEQGDEKIVITSETWSNHFVLFKVPVTRHAITLSNN
ncbi:hypothetical protein [Brevibacillus sp. NRS-1366]|uniref:hypothetical protein n=1 Tax=Brevibacillus sp. NRS-1366 TaxID=3233899 RepID=UPI003D23CF9D